MFTGRVSALPPITYSRQKDFRLIRPLAFVTEDITARYAESLGAPITPCGCSERTGTVRKSIRSLFSEIEIAQQSDERGQDAATLLLIDRF